jgi:glycosyltransferase involved in cell wall biosynthesis
VSDTLNIRLKILSNSKKILIVTECFYPEEFKINDVALAWKDQGYEVHILTLVPTYPLGKVFSGYKNFFFRKEDYKGLTIFRVRAVTGYRDSIFKKILKYINFMFFGSFAALFLGKKYDYVLGFNASALTSMVPAVVIRKLYKVPLTFWAQDVWPGGVYAYGFKKTKILSFLLNTFVEFMYRNIDAIAISCKGFESKLAPFIKAPLTYYYLPNWADSLDGDALKKNLGGVDGLTHFTFAGNIGKMQNLENIIIAFLSLSIKYKDRAQLNIIGDGSNLDSLRLLASNASNIIFHGKKLRSSMASYYNASDFLIVSLIDEPIFSVIVPAKTQTYIAAKKPILAIINGDTANLVEEHNLGLCADPSDIESIKSVLAMCVDMDASERNSFTSNNDDLLATIFNKEKTIDSLLNIVKATAQ